MVAHAVNVIACQPRAGPWPWHHHLLHSTRDLDDLRGCLCLCRVCLSHLCLSRVCLSRLDLCGLCSSRALHLRVPSRRLVSFLRRVRRRLSRRRVRRRLIRPLLLDRRRLIRPLLLNRLLLPGDRCCPVLLLRLGRDLGLLRQLASLLLRRFERSDCAACRLLLFCCRPQDTLGFFRHGLLLCSSLLCSSLLCDSSMILLGLLLAGALQRQAVLVIQRQAVLVNARHLLLSQRLHQLLSSHRRRHLCN